MLTLRNGDVLRLSASFQHKGAAYAGASIRAALGQERPDYLGGFDEKLIGTVSITGIIADAIWTTYNVIIDIPIVNIGTALFPAGNYEVYAKLINIPGGDIFWFGPVDDIVLEAPPAAAEFSNLFVAYSKK